MERNIKHHIPDELLMAYAAGSLNEAFSLVVASHVSLCDSCRAKVEAYEVLGGALLENGPTLSAPMGQDSLTETLAMIDAGPTPEPETKRVRGGALPGPLQDYAGGDLDSVRWRPIGMGVKQSLLLTSQGATARLLYIPTGTAVPDHGHNGLEMTLVLKGSFSDEDAEFQRGDVEIADDHIEHTPIAGGSEDCICLAVTDAPLRFRGLIPRLAQPFLKI